MCSQRQSEYAYAILYSSKPAQEMFPELVLVFSADAAHCTAPAKGIIIRMYGNDVKNVRY